MIQSTPSSFNNFSDNNSSKANSSQADLPMDQAAVEINTKLKSPIKVVKLKELPDKEKDTGVKIEPANMHQTVPSSKDPVIKEANEKIGFLILQGLFEPPNSFKEVYDAFVDDEDE
ncbi:unnamed protein product [Diamesa serratosioi]